MIPTEKDLRAWGERTREESPNINGKVLIAYADAWRTEVDALQAENARLLDKLAGLAASLAVLAASAKEEIL